MSFEDEARERINSLQDQVTELASLLHGAHGRQQAQHLVLQALITTHQQPQVIAELLLQASDRAVEVWRTGIQDEDWYKPLQEYAQLAAHTAARNSRA